MKLNYYIMDVFTRQALSGNPLAVVLKADELGHERMQAIAGEFGLSETVFVCKPSSNRHSATLKIFTPKSELPFSGHGTVGAGVLLAIKERLSGVRFEEHVGLITAVTAADGPRRGSARFALPRLPESEAWEPDGDRIAQALGLSPSDIGLGRMEPALYSAGNPYYLVPVRDAGVLREIRLERRGWRETFPIGDSAVYAFTQTPEESYCDYAARMFSPSLAAGEDPATGSAAAALIGLLSATAEEAEGQFDVTIRQGKEMRRPSLIALQFRKRDGVLFHAGIGGEAVVVAEGTLDLRD
ncbi:MAG TPA: PhzF family phenazine biosynthesis protein [Devosiaceae bacterium]